MPQTDTKYFGTMQYHPESVYDFPSGLPAFENERSFVLIELPEHAPLIFLQSLTQPQLCFLALPIQVIDRRYKLQLSLEDLVELDLDRTRQPLLGTEVTVLALVSLHEGFSATANLMAPIVVNLRSRRAIQAIRGDSVYSHQFPVERPAAEPVC